MGKLEKQTNVDIRKHTKLIKCTKEHSHEKCVICFERFEENDKCLELNCGHFFHKTEIEKHLFHTSCCPLCKRMITEPPIIRKTRQSELWNSVNISNTNKRIINEKYEKEETKNIETDIMAMELD